MFGFFLLYPSPHPQTIFYIINDKPAMSLMNECGTIQNMLDSYLHRFDPKHPKDPNVLPIKHKHDRGVKKKLVVGTIQNYPKLLN